MTCTPLSRHRTFTARLRTCLFASPLDTLLTLVALGLLTWIGSGLLHWLVIDAQWRGDSPLDCPDRNALCWPFVRARFDQFIYGLYPRPERWRINVGVCIVALGAAPLFMPRFPHKGLILAGLFALLPLVGYGLFFGGVSGLPVVETSLWGGFFLTVVTAVFVLATSLPVAVLLALGRESALPAIRIVCGAWVEFWRSVPALVVLFVAIIMFPMFMPAGMEIDKLLRALLALAVLMSCYLAEALRGALQAIPRGQYEAAAALGLGYWRSTLFVILPQAIPTALPQITSNFIGLFKETTVLLIIGLFDLLGMVQTAASDPQWLSPGVSATGYVFAAGFYWMFCFGLSRYGAWLEQRTSGYRGRG